MAAADVVTDWSVTAADITVAAGLGPPPANRTLAMVQTGDGHHEEVFMNESALSNALSKLDVVNDVMTVKRVFGDAYQLDGVTVIPVAAVRGGNA